VVLFVEDPILAAAARTARTTRTSLGSTTESVRQTPYPRPRGAVMNAQEKKVFHATRH